MVAAAIGVSAAAGLAGSALSSSAASDAANTQAQAADQASQLQFQMFNQMQGNLQPYMALGTSNIGNVNNQLYNLQQYQAGGGAAFNAPPPQFNWQPTEAQLQSTPGYQFTLNQGMQNTNNALAAKGLNMSGAQARGLAQYTTGLADQTYQQNFNVANQSYQNSMENYNAALNTFKTNYGVTSDQYNRLAGLVGLGQNAAAGVGNAGLQTASTAGNYLTQGANAQAAGTIGSANAISSGLNGLGNNSLMYSMLSGNAGIGAASQAATGVPYSPGSLYSLMNIGANNAVL